MRPLTVAGWIVLLSGIALVAAYSVSCIRRGVREARLRQAELAQDPRGDLFSRRTKAALEEGAALLREMGFAAALERSESALDGPDLLSNERAALLLLRADAKAGLGDDPGPALREVLGSSCELTRKLDASCKLARAARERGDLRGTIRILEDAIATLDPRERPPTPAEAYSLHFMASGLSELYEETGDARRAYDWARRAQIRYAFDGHCGNAIREVHGWGEDRIVRTAAGVGVSYSPRPFDEAEWERRRHGAPLPDAVAWGGAALLILGVLWTGRRRARATWGRLIWRRRPYLLGRCMPALLAVGAAALLLLMASDVPGLGRAFGRSSWAGLLSQLVRSAGPEAYAHTYWSAVPAWFLVFIGLACTFVLSLLAFLGSLFGGRIRGTGADPRANRDPQRSQGKRSVGGFA